MKKLTLLLSLSIYFSLLPAKAYFFATDVETKITSLSSDSLILEITQHDDKEETEVYPIGTKLYGNLFEYKKRKHFMRNELLKVYLEKAVLPNGKVESVHKNIIIKPKVFLNAQYFGTGIAGTTGLVLSSAIATWSIGFPVARGGKAVIDSAFATYNTPEKESKWEQGIKGFFKGALFPLPELIFKGDRLPIHKGSYIWIQDAKEHKQSLTAFLVKRKNLFLDNEKYYNYTKEKPISFSHLLKKKKPKTAELLL